MVTTVVEGTGPRKIIAERANELVAEFQRKNPGVTKLGPVRIQAEQTAIIDYLETLHRRGKI
jgi:hypothetical protein